MQEGMDERHERLLEAVRLGGPGELSDACAKLVRLWKDAPVEPLLTLKEQFQKVGLDRREASLDEALVSLAERRLEPFIAVVSELRHPYWAQAVEVVSLTRDARILDVLLSLIPECPRRSLPMLVRGIGCFRERGAVEALGRFLSEKDDDVLFEAVSALSEIGDSTAQAYLKSELATRQSDGELAAAQMIEEALRPRGEG